MTKDNSTPKFCPHERGIDSWRFRLKHSRYGKWNSFLLGDIPPEALMELWEAESLHPGGSFVADKLLGELIRRELIGDGRHRRRKRRRKRQK